MARRIRHTTLALALHGKRASLYVRLSKAADGENTSKDGMIADVRALAESQGFEEVALHVDDGRSGGFRDRPEFLAWIADVREGRADVLIAWHVDRMTREGINVAAMLLDLVEGKDPLTGRLRFSPVRLMDTRGLDSNDGDSFRWRFVIAAEVARAERQRMRDRAAAKDERLRRAGRWPGGGAPFGFRIVHNSDGPGKTLVVDPAESAIIREAARLVLADWPLGRAVRTLNRQGLAPRRAKEWSRTTLRQVLTGDAVLGRMVVHGEVLRDEDGNAATPFPAILTLRQSLALREALAQVEDPARRKGGRLPTRLLSTLLVCHSCESVLQVAARTDGTVTYRCQRSSDGGVCDRQVVVSAPAIETWAETFYLGRFGRLAETEKRVVAADAEDVAALDDAIAAVVATLAKAATPETFAKLQELQARRAEAVLVAPTAPRMLEVLTGRTKAEEWQRQDTEGRRAMFLRDVGRLTIGPGRRGRRGFDPERLVGFDLDALPEAEDVGLGGSDGFEASA